MATVSQKVKLPIFVSVSLLRSTIGNFSNIKVSASTCVFSALVIAKSDRLQQEIDEVLSEGNKKNEKT
jgi:hypothetical protein